MPLPTNKSRGSSIQIPLQGKQASSDATLQHASDPPVGSDYMNTSGMFGYFAVLFGAMNQPDSSNNQTGVAFSVAHISTHNVALTPAELALLHVKLSAAERDLTTFNDGARSKT